VDNELEVIRHQMEEKRASLADKLGVLEDEVLQTVHQATAAVSDTVQDVTEVVGTVKQSVTETVESIKDSLDIRVPIRDYPWTALGVSFAAGFAGAILLEDRPSSNRTCAPTGQRPHGNGYSSESARPNGNGSAQLSAPAGSSLAGTGDELLHQVKGMAIGTLMGVIDTMVRDVVPPAMKGDVHQLFEDLNTRLGGRRLYQFGTTQGEASSEATT